eukprot:TRINITY_DN3450_c0_g1_i1.p1 TRINITY_DN3450_c0_g1~~TRINITY_DN3450_c0_g1_i1.p1  ORF type:complete len:238 (+),score=-6.80 TRINITY_DN3450_c0_g1_i1:24-737(+)
MEMIFFFFFSSRRRHTRSCLVSWARRCVQETELVQLDLGFRKWITKNMDENGEKGNNPPSYGRFHPLNRVRCIENKQEVFKYTEKMSRARHAILSCKCFYLVSWCLHITYRSVMHHSPRDRSDLIWSIKQGLQQKRQECRMSSISRFLSIQYINLRFSMMRSLRIHLQQLVVTQPQSSIVSNFSLKSRLELSGLNIPSKILPILSPPPSTQDNKIILTGSVTNDVGNQYDRSSYVIE